MAVDRTDYEVVAASATAQVLGAEGHIGDILDTVIVTVSTAATGTVSIADGDGAAIPITAANTPIGVYSVRLGLRAKAATTPGWKVTTGAGASVLAVGRFA
jgi:hypothetical protein